MMMICQIVLFLFLLICARSTNGICTCSCPVCSQGIASTDYTNQTACMSFCAVACPSDVVKADLVCSSEGASSASASASSSSGDCLGGGNLVYSCTACDWVPLRDVVVGDKIRSITNNGPVCSDVYFVYKHGGSSQAVGIELEDEEGLIQVSKNHLLYVGESFDERRTELAKNIRPGDLLITSSGTPKTVASVLFVISDLVNVLTVEPAIELSNGIIVSAHSHHEEFYCYLFWPIRLVYEYLGGASSVANMSPLFDMVDTYISQPLAAISG